MKLIADLTLDARCWGCEGTGKALYEEHKLPDGACVLCKGSGKSQTKAATCLTCAVRHGPLRFRKRSPRRSMTGADGGFGKRTTSPRHQTPTSATPPTGAPSWTARQ